MNGKIKEWKKKYGKVYKTKAEGKEYIFRTLNVGETCEILALFQKNSIEEAEDFALRAVLYPEDFNLDNLSNVAAKKLAEQILELSRIFDPRGIQEIIVKAREHASESLKNDFFRWKLDLMGIFPSYKLSDLDDMSIQEFFKLIALAEEMLGKKLINDGKIEESVQTVEAEVPKEELIAKQGGKFLSQKELEMISADSATNSLMQHWKKHKG